MQINMRPAGVPPDAAKLIAGGAKLGDIFFDEYYEYGITFSFAGSDTQTNVIQVQSDAHFIWVTAYMNCSVATNDSDFQGAGVNRGGSVVLVTDVGANRQLANTPVPANCLFGSAQRPFVLPLRKLFRASGGIQLQVTDTTGSTQVTDYIFGGFKIPLDHGRQLGLNP